MHGYEVDGGMFSLAVSVILLVSLGLIPDEFYLSDCLHI